MSLLNLLRSCSFRYLDLEALQRPVRVQVSSSTASAILKPKNPASEWTCKTQSPLSLISSTAELPGVPQRADSQLSRFDSRFSTRLPTSPEQIKHSVGSVGTHAGLNNSFACSRLSFLDKFFKHIFPPISLGKFNIIR